MEKDLDTFKTKVKRYLVDISLYSLQEFTYLRSFNLKRYLYVWLLLIGKLYGPTYQVIVSQNVYSYFLLYYTMNYSSYNLHLI